MATKGGGSARLPAGEFRALWFAEALSVIGDQLAKVAVALLVYRETGSAALSGLAFGVTFLPPLIIAPTLSGLADRHPRRSVLVVCLLAQGATVSVMAAPGLHPGVVVVGAMTVSAIQVVFKAAHGPIVRDILGDELNKSGRAHLGLVREVGQLLGLVGAAFVVDLIGVSASLVVDGGTFLVAAVLIRAGVGRRPAARGTASGGRSPTIVVLRLLRTDRSLRSLVILIGLIGFTTVPEAIVVPFAAEAGAPTWLIGPLLAADCLGVILSLAVVKRQPPARQRRLIAPLFVISTAPMALFLLRPTAVAAMALLFATGVGAAYLALSLGEFTERIPDEVAGTASGLINAVLRASQGITAIVAGLLAQWLSATTAIAVFGVCGVVLSSIYGRSWHRAQNTGSEGEDRVVLRTRGRSS